MSDTQENHLKILRNAINACITNTCTNKEDLHSVSEDLAMSVSCWFASFSDMSITLVIILMARLNLVLSKYKILNGVLLSGA